MNRFLHIQFIVSTLLFSWLAMQGVHEFGHVLHAWASGGRVTLVVLDPLDISRTDVSPNPHPQFVAWGGPVWGSLIPLGIYGLLHWRKWSRTWVAAFFAGFCLIANGGYLLGGSVYPVGDAETLLTNGAPRMALAAFGIAALVSGLAIWNGLGRHFGFGRSPVPIDRRVAWAMSAVALLLVVAELFWSRASTQSGGSLPTI